MHHRAIHAAVVAFVLGATGSAAAAAAAPVQTNVQTTNDIPNQFIVEYTQDAPLAARDLGSDPSLKVLRNFESSIFNGAAVELAEDGDINTLAAKPHIANVWPNRRVMPSRPVTTAQSASTKLKRRANADELANDTVPYTPHNATGVNLLHDQGIYGKGVKVGVVDTGVWYTHVALGGGFGPGYKVAGGYDLVGNVDLSSGAPLQPNDNPIDSLEYGHGTHVAGIVAGFSDGFVGVAPNATLYAYKVVGNYSESSTEAVLIDAFLRAEADGMDVITASWSFASGWTADAWAVVVSRVVEAGIIVTTAAGNTGTDGAFSGVGGGSSQGGLTIASVEGQMTPATTFTIDLINTDGTANETILTGYVGDDVFPQTIVGWPIIDMGSTDPNSIGDACSAYPAGTRNLTGTIPLIRRGGCDFLTKQENLYALGGSFVLIYTDDRPVTPPGNTLPDGTLGMITAELGAVLVQALRDSNMTATADFDIPAGEPVAVGLPSSDAGTPDYFSGWAATYDLQLKPDLAAPGGNILSTWPSVNNDAYMVQSGTSMSTPYIAGIAALYISQHGGRASNPNVAKDFHRRVAASGRTLPWTTSAEVVSDTFHAPPTQMGSGMVDAYQTLFGASEIDVTQFNLNDTVHFNAVHQVTLSNKGNTPVAYNFTLEPAAGFLIQNPWFETWQTWGIYGFDDLVPMDLVPDVALPEAVTLAAGESKTLTVTFTNPENKGWNATLLPLYSGKVNIAGNNGDHLSVSYMGLATDLYAEKKVFQNPYPSFFSGSTFADINTNSTFAFNYTNTSDTAAYSYPGMFYALDWGVRELRWDIFEPNWDESRWVYPPTRESGLVGLTRLWGSNWDTSDNPLDPAVVKALSNPSPIVYQARDGIVSRSTEQSNWLGHMVAADGGSVVDFLGPGNYTMRIAASRPFADLSKVDGWEVVRYQITVL